MIRLGNGLALCFWGEHRIPSSSEIALIVQQCSMDPAALLELRSMVYERSGSLAEPLDGDALLERVAALLQSGEIMVYGVPMQLMARTGGAPAGRSSSAPPPRSAATRRPSTPPPEPPPPDPPTIPPTSDRAALVALMRSAADSGTPFCDT